MAKREEHLLLYEKNKKLCENNLFVNEKKNYDWLITIKYYAMLHRLDATLAYEKIHEKTHVKKKEKMDDVGGYKKVRVQYEALESLSRQARYDCIEITIEQVNEAIQREARLETFLDGIDKKRGVI